jgi:fucose permease
MGVKKTTGIVSLSVTMSSAAMMLTGIGLALPRLAGDLKFSELQQGALVSIQYVGFTLAVLAGGALSDRFGRTRMLRLALLGLAVAAALFGGVWSYWVAIAAVLLIGVFGSILENSITALALEDEKRQDVNNIIVQAAFCAGAMLLPLLFLVSMLWRGAWRPPYFLAGALLLVLFFFSLKGRSGEAPSQTVPFSRILGQYMSFFKNPAYLIAPAALFLYVGAEVGLWAFAPAFFESNGYGVYSGVISSILIWLLMMFGRMATTWIVGKLGIIRTMLVFAVLAMVSLALMMASGGVWAVVCTALAGFACAPFFPLIVSWMTRITGEKSSTMIAFTMAAGTLGSVVLGYLMGWFGSIFGTGLIMLLPLACFAGIFVLLAVFGKKGQRADS